MIAWEIVGILLSLVFSAFFSASETALSSLGRAHTEKLIDEGGRLNKSLQLWVDHPLRVLNAILIGNNIVNITASALATDLSNRLLGGTAYQDTAIPIAVGLMTLLLLTFGEIVPKSLARSQSERLAPWAIWLLKVPYALFYPGTLAFTWLAKKLITSLGGTSEQNTPPVTEEDIEYMVDLGSRVGSLEEGKGRMLQSVFEYTSTVVREIMVARTDMQTLSVEATLKETMEAMERTGHSRLPIYEGNVDNIVGVFYAKDLLRYFAQPQPPGGTFQLRDFLRRPFFVVEPMKISDLLNEFQRRRTHMAIVVDEFGTTAGLITLEDIIEEFVGDIQDEYDDEDSWLDRLPNGNLLVDARCTVSEVEEALDVEFPEERDYTSVGGLIVATTGTVPEAGAEVRVAGILFKVLESDEKRVIKAQIIDERPLQNPESSSGEGPRMAS